MKEIIYKEREIKYLDEPCPSCKENKLTYGQIPCPDNIPGCCIYHQGYTCHNCNKRFT